MSVKERIDSLFPLETPEERAIQLAAEKKNEEELIKKINESNAKL